MIEFVYGQLIRTTNIHMLHFPHRDKLVELALTMQGYPFPQPGSYVIELHCNAQWVRGVSPMKYHQPETVFAGERQQFSDTGLSPDDPAVRERVSQRSRLNVKSPPAKKRKPRKKG